MRRIALPDVYDKRMPLWLQMLEYASLGVFAILDMPMRLFLVAFFAMPDDDGIYNDV